MSMFDISFEDFGVAGDLAGFADDLSNLHGGLEKIVNEVAIPAMATNFEVGGRPAWEPLSPDTVEIKGNSEPLIKTGRLYGGSQARSSWDISDTEASFSGAAGAEYGKFHQFGTRKMPMREWAALAPEDEDKAEEVMVEWIAEQLGNHGFSVFASSFGSGDF